jgi:hypothetical protein
MVREIPPPNTIIMYWNGVTFRKIRPEERAVAAAHRIISAENSRKEERGGGGFISRRRDSYSDSSADSFLPVLQLGQKYSVSTSSSPDPASACTAGTPQSQPCGQANNPSTPWREPRPTRAQGQYSGNRQS